MVGLKLEGNLVETELKTTCVILDFWWCFDCFRESAFIDAVVL